MRASVGSSAVRSMTALRVEEEIWTINEDQWDAYVIYISTHDIRKDRNDMTDISRSCFLVVVQITQVLHTWSYH